MQNTRNLANEIADAIWRRNDRVELTRYVEESLRRKAISINDPKVLAGFDALKRSVRRVIENKILHARSRGTTPRYHFAEIDTDVLLPQSDASLDQIRDEMILSIQALGWRPFELLCVHLLSLSGATRCHAMRGTQEEGIDLFGVLDLGELTRTSVWHGVRLRLLGQAKKSRVDEPRVRLFNQDRESFVAGSGRAFNLAPDWFKELKAPLMGFFLTASRFTKPALTWAGEHNIATKDAEQMAEDLMRAASGERTPGLSGSGQAMTFDRDAFRHHFERRSA